MSKREMKADVYDYLELAALAFGGIGRGAFYDDSRGRVDYDCPLCVHGAGFACEPLNTISETDVTSELSRLGIKYDTNDRAVEQINARLGRWKNTRVTWTRFRKHLGIVRAEATNA